MIILAVSMFSATSISALGDRQREIEREKAQLREKIREAERQAKTLNGQIAESDRRRAALERDISSLNGQLFEAERRLAETELALTDARNELLSLENSLTHTLARLDDIKARLDARVRSSYINGPAPLVEMLVSARSLSDFLTRFHYVRQVITSDRTRLDAVERLSKQLDAARNEAVQRKSDIEAYKAAIEEERANISRLRAEVSGKRHRVVEEIANRKGLLSKVQADRATYLREMARIEAESKSITLMLRNRQRGQVYQAGSGQRLAWPTTGRVTSGFGYRTHPIFGDERFHTGIDIAAPSGQAVIAAEAGEVIFVGVRSGYGLTIIIDHGNALATLYAHLSSVNVGSGARVARGSRIGGVGCTGYCTGPHLHFETRIKGDPVDPMQFF